MNEARIFEEARTIETKKPWERQEHEPARWFMRFRRYLAGGHKRSVNAVFEAERQEKAGKSSNKAGETWYGAAKRYEWEARASAYDEHVQGQKAEAMRKLAASSPFISRPYRLMQLNSLADSVSRLIEQGQAPDVFLPLCKQLQALMHDISSEVAIWDAPIDATCDAAALDATIAKMLRLRDIQIEHELDQEAQIDALAKKHEMLERINKANRELRQTLLND
jgi:hypothetical protein